LRALLARYLAGEASGEITLMHLVLGLGDAGLLGSLLATLAGAAPESRELAELLRLAKTNMEHLAQVTALAKDGLVNIPSDDGDAVTAIREQFDSAVAVAPEASVALYSLGSADILDRATSEIVGRMSEWRLLRPDGTVLDIGCGIGRIERALAPLVGAITGIDISSGMIEEARRRCGNLDNVAFEQCGGRDFAGFRDRSFDLVMAVDSFPYLFAADPKIVARHLRDAARILRPGGAVVILNFSYRGDAEADRREIQRLAAANGFSVRRAGTRDFSLWDGLTFLLTLPALRE
jgi:ubiquinone/menaquinone biosynthesis C-methylase UbiE